MRQRRLDPLIEETFAAATAMTALAVLVAGAYWLLTGDSPWPELVLGEVAAFGFGIAVLALTAPRRGS